MLQTLGENLEEFTEKLDALHSSLAKGWAEMNAPSFHVEKSTDRAMLYYYSDRGGLCLIMPGRTDRSSVAREFFNSEVTMLILNQGEEKEHTGKKEHVIFLVLQKHKSRKASNIYSNSARFFLPQRHLCHLKSSPCPHSVCFILFCSLTENLLLILDPVYPKRLWVEERTFCCAFPFLLVFDEATKQACVNTQKFISGIWNAAICLDKYFAIIHPQYTFTIFSIRINKHQESVCSQNKRRKIHLNKNVCVGNVIVPCLIYLCSPKLHSLEELEELKMHLPDIVPHDMMRVLILLNHQHLAETEMYNQLERRRKSSGYFPRIWKQKRRQQRICCMPYCQNTLPVIAGIGHFMTVEFLAVCQFETIAVAYMVIREVPVPIASFAARVAHLVLGMGVASQEVMNPITEEPIRVLPHVQGGKQEALCGLAVYPCAVHDELGFWAFCLDHGLNSFAQSAQNQGSKIDARGETEVKGKKKMTIYFLRKNLHMTIEIRSKVTALSDKAVLKAPAVTRIINNSHRTAQASKKGDCQLC
uniref:guanylate cyclase n=1 Tax=Apteryx owenii TaxID=8824 RepID=A0A8B9PBQ1_APTOW